jgi:hypothetical protein
MYGFIGADAFDDLEANAMFRCQISPSGARRLNRIDRIDDDGMAKTEIFVRQRLRNLISRDTCFGSSETRAPQRRLDFVDRAASTVFPEPRNPDTTISMGEISVICALRLWPSRKSAVAADTPLSCGIRRN